MKNQSQLLRALQDVKSIPLNVDHVYCGKKAEAKMLRG